MPSGVNNYNKKCHRCNIDFLGKMGGQKWCIPCGIRVGELRKYGLKGLWTKKKELSMLLKIKNSPKINRLFRGVN